MTPTQPSERQTRVLIVDDDAPLRLSARVSLQRKGFSVEIQDSGEGAIELLKQNSYDVIVLDYDMPGMTGLNVMQWMLEEKNDTPVVMLTGAGSEGIAVEAMKLGAYDYIRKEHIELEHLAIIIRGVHEQSLFRKERALREQILRDKANLHAAAKMFEVALHSLTHIVNSELTFVKLHLNEIKELSTSQSSTADRVAHLGKLSDDLLKAFSTLTSAVQSMFSLAGALQIKLSPEEDPTHVEELLQKVQQLQEQYARASDESE